MAFVTVEAMLEKFVNSILNKTGGVADNWELKLFSNNITPSDGDVVGDYTEVAGGGYADKNLDKAEFTVTPGDPAQGLYSDFLDFTFTGATDSPGTVYGYYMVDGDGDLIGAERFSSDVVPITPVNGTLIRVKPRVLIGNV